MNKFLTEEVRKKAFDLGADIVGFANIERFENAPVEASPQGLMPTAKTVVVIGIHHPDAVIELSGYPSPREVKSYYIQMTMCDKLEHILYQIAKFLEKKGFMSLPTNATNSQRYRAIEGSPHTFLAEISHRHAAAAAGLGEFGWSGLLITPEYGPRVRFLSLVTEAELEPTTLYNGPKLCDRCGECIKHCPSKALSLEIDGITKIQIENKTFEYANKNNWRCGWTEHWAFDLTLPLPDKIGENEILEAAIKSGSTGGSLGQCLKYCLPPMLRAKYSDDGIYGHKRKKHVIANAEIPPHRSVLDKIKGVLIENNIDNLFVIDGIALNNRNIYLKDYLPDGKCILAFSANFEQCSIQDINGFDINNKLISVNKDTDVIIKLCVENAVLDSCRVLESYGFSAVPIWPEVKDAFISTIEDEINSENISNIKTIWGIIVTNLPFKTDIKKAIFSNKDKIICDKKALTSQILNHAKNLGIDLVGICSVKRANIVAEQLKEIYEGKDIVMSLPINAGLGGYRPKVKKIKRKVLEPRDYIKDAKSIITIGFHFPYGIIQRVGKPPANNYMLYSLMISRTLKEVGKIGYGIIKYLNSLGYKAIMSYDLFNVSSYTITLEGEHYDISANNILAPISGLGEISKNGMAITPEYGITQRLLAIITNADLEENEIFNNPSLIDKCINCSICTLSCPTKALNENRMVHIRVEEKEIKYIKVNQFKCDWAKRYALVETEGTKSIDMRTNIIPSQDPDIIEFEEALKKLDPIQRLHPTVGQNCILCCPYVDEYSDLLEIYSNMQDD